MPQWTDEQETFFTFLDREERSCLLQARAGSGKTTTLVEGSHRLRGSALAVAFNVKIKKELEERIGDNVVCKTMNGVGHRALCNFLGRRVVIDRDKNYKIFLKIIGDDKRKKESWSAASQLISRAKHNGLVPNGISCAKRLYPDEADAWEDLADHYGLDFDLNILTLAREVLREHIAESWKGRCDFDDQIYIPVCWDVTFDQFDNVLVDEAQDLSHLQHRIVEKCCRGASRVIAAGDSHQAIYGWRAAASDSMDILAERFAMTELSLSMSFRCGRRIIQEAQEIVPSIYPRPDAHEGSVQNWSAFSAGDFEHGDVILCRNNGPLVQQIYRLIRSGIPCYMIGRDIGRGLKALIKKLEKWGAYDIPSLLYQLEVWKKQETQRLEAKKKYSQMQAVEDKADSLGSIIEGCNATTVADVAQEIDALFSKDSGKVALSTVHRAKGMEWKRVFILDPNLMPSRWAQRAYTEDPIRGEWMMQEEHNIRYVAITRAINDLIYVRSEDWE